MKILPTLLTLIMGIGFVCHVQAQPANKKKITLNDESVVKDSAGAVYPAAIWKNLLSTGRYTVRIKNPQDETPEFVLIRISEEEYRKRMENSPQPRESEYFTTGTAVPSFTGTDIHGKKYKLKDLKGKVVVMNFWFIACQPCQQEIPELNTLVDEYKDSTNVVFLAICLDEKYQIEQFLEKKPFRYNILDNGRYITTQYGIRSYPTHVILDKNGVVVFHTSGYSFGLVPWLRKGIAKALE